MLFCGVIIALQIAFWVEKRANNRFVSGLDHQTNKSQYYVALLTQLSCSRCFRKISNRKITLVNIVYCKLWMELMQLHQSGNYNKHYFDSIEHIKSGWVISRKKIEKYNRERQKREKTERGKQQLNIYKMSKEKEVLLFVCWPKTCAVWVALPSISKFQVA